MSSRLPISVVIPVYNEEKCICFVFEELSHILKTNFRQYEIIFADDYSNDGTLKILRSISEQNPNVKVVSLEERHGQSWAIFAGIRSASYERVAIMDGDGQYNPHDILVLNEHLEGNVKLVSGKRDNRKDNYLYRTLSKIGNKAISGFLGVRMGDLGCGLKIGNKKQLLSIPYFKYVHRYFQVIYYYSGVEYKEIRIDHRTRADGNSKYSILKVFNILPRVLWLRTFKIKLQE
jgi:dolichol-phosphate mannosyltransferase